MFGFFRARVIRNEPLIPRTVERRGVPNIVRCVGLTYPDGLTIKSYIPVLGQVQDANSPQRFSDMSPPKLVKCPICRDGINFLQCGHGLSGITRLLTH